MAGPAISPALLGALQARGFDTAAFSALARSGADPTQMMLERLDPPARELYELCKARAAAAAEAVEGEPDAIGDLLCSLAPIRLPAPRPRLPEAARQRLAFLERTNAALAGALGACAACWGQNEACIRCEGAGLPGSSPPDLELYRALVIPAVRARQAHQAAMPAAPAAGGGRREGSPAWSGVHAAPNHGDGNAQ